MSLRTTYESEVDDTTITVEVEIDKREIETFGELVKTAFRTAMEFGRKLVVAVLDARDEELRESRDKKRYRCKGKRKTCIKTRLGEIEFSRNVYRDRAAPEAGNCIYLLDKELGINRVGLASEDLCGIAAKAVCETTYRGASKLISETTGQSISAQGVWNIIQKIGTRRGEQIEQQADEATRHMGTGVVESPILYEENDGVWLALQGKSRKENGRSKEMKVGIAYDGVQWELGKGGKKRRTLDCKVAYASFESAREFQRNKEGVVASRFNVDEVELRVINGDGAQWIQRHGDADCISVLDQFHRNKKITECVRDPEFAKLLRSLLYEKRIDDLLECLEAQINSVMDEQEKADLRDLQKYYLNNKDALLGYYDRGRTIPPTKEPGVIHHARLGSMESNVFTLIGNRMKGRRACWSIDGANHLALILCAYHTTGFESMFVEASETEKECCTDVKCSASSVPKRVGKGAELYRAADLPGYSWLRDLTAYVPFTEMSFA